MCLRFKKECLGLIFKPPVVDVSPYDFGTWFGNLDAPGFPAFSVYDVNMGASTILEMDISYFEVAGLIAAHSGTIHC